MTNKLFRIQLPVGTVLNGMRHLGNGEFGYQLGHADGNGFAVVVGLVAPGVEWPTHVQASIEDDPLDRESAVKVFSKVRLAIDGRPIDEGVPPEIFLELARASGLVIRPPGAWIDPASALPDADGWYERECDAGYAVFSMWTASLGEWIPSVGASNNKYTAASKVPGFDEGKSRWRSMAVPLHARVIP